MSWIKFLLKGKSKAHGHGLWGGMGAVYEVNASLFTEHKICEAAKTGFRTPMLSDFC